MLHAPVAPRSAPGRPTYRRRRPETTALYRIVQTHLATFLARLDADPDATRWPAFVVRELDAFLRCGILAHGFARVHCDHCGKDALVAFSCKGRGFCPSCGGRRMADTAAHLGLLTRRVSFSREEPGRCVELTCLDFAVSGRLCQAARGAQRRLSYS